MASTASPAKDEGGAAAEKAVVDLLPVQHFPAPDAIGYFPLDELLPTALAQWAAREPVTVSVCAPLADPTRLSDGSGDGDLVAYFLIEPSAAAVHALPPAVRRLMCATLAPDTPGEGLEAFAGRQRLHSSVETLALDHPVSVRVRTELRAYLLSHARQRPYIIRLVATDLAQRVRVPPYAGYAAYRDALLLPVLQQCDGIVFLDEAVARDEALIMPLASTSRGPQYWFMSRAAADATAPLGNSIWVVEGGDTAVDQVDTACTRPLTLAGLYRNQAAVQLLAVVGHGTPAWLEGDEDERIVFTHACLVPPAEPQLEWLDGQYAAQTAVVVPGGAGTYVQYYVAQ